MKRIKLFVLVVLALSLFAGCGKKEAKEETETLQEKSSNDTDSSGKKSEKKEKKKEDKKSKDDTLNEISAVNRPEFDIIYDYKIIYSLNDRYEAGEMSVSYLQLKENVEEEYSKLSAALDEINEESKQKFEANISEFTEEAQRFYDKNSAENLSYGYDMCWNLSDITVTRADEEYTSFFIRKFNFWGDGEAADSYKCVNLNSQTGKEIELSDVVADENVFEKAVEELFAKKFGNEITRFGAKGPSSFDWCLTPLGINVYFSREYPEISSLCGNYLNVSYDSYPDAFNENFKPKNDDYVYPFNADEDLYTDIDNDGTVEKISFGVTVPEGFEDTNDREGYIVRINDKEYNDFGQTWFFDWQPYYVHTADGAYIYAYLSGYENDKIDVIRLDKNKAEYEKSLPADNLYAREEPGTGDLYRYRSNAFTNSKILQQSGFAIDACGEYLYQPVVGEDEEGMGEWLVELYEFDGKYYIEEMSDYKYGAGEIELLSDTPTPCADGYSYKIKIHYFSGFSFVGDYHGSGYECELIVHEDGSIVLKGEQPVGQGGDTILFPYKDNNIHFNLLNQSVENLDCPAVIGAWRYCGTDENNESFENYLELYENGTAVLVSKTETYPVNVMIGNYNVFNLSDMNESIITFFGELMGYACMPSDEMEFSYDYISDTLTCAPNGYDDTASVMEYHRTSKGEYDIDIVPGPASRTNQLMKDWEEYNMPFSDDAEENN